MLQIQNLTMIYRKDERCLLKDFHLTVNRGDKTALIGEEGNGKSTLLKWIHDPESVKDYMDVTGRCTSDEKIGYLPQTLSEEDGEKTVYEFLSEEDGFFDDPALLSDLIQRCHVSYDLVYSEQKMSTLSGGEKVKIEMMRVLLSTPGILLLDEPSNDLDLETLDWLQGMIRNAREGILFISHDEVLLSSCAKAIVHMELLKRKQESRWTYAAVGYDEYVKRRADSLARQAKLAESDAREAKIRDAKMQRIQQSVEHDLRNVSRQDPHTGYLLKKKMKAVKSMEKRFAREDENMTEKPESEEAIVFFFDDQCAVPQGKRVIDADLDELKTPDGRVLARKLHLSVYGPKKVCIIGKNGCGKTTLLRKIAGSLLSRDDLRAAYMPQDYHEVLNESLTPVQYLSDGTKDGNTKAGLMLGAMKYTTDEMSHAIGNLSMGQKAKLLFLKMNLDKADVLILDEPTRNFSPLSQPVIRSVLKAYGGCIISVSHDRKYIEEVADTLYRLEEDGLKEVSHI